jgi:TonB family protein
VRNYDSSFQFASSRFIAWFYIISVVAVWSGKEAQSARMRYWEIPLVIVAALSASIALATEETKTIDGREALAVYAPRPTYPYEARLRYLQGSGAAIVTIDPATGNVTNVVMAISTGARSLDDETISTFRRWRFKPGTVKKVRIPITFTFGGQGSVVRVDRALPMDQVLAPFLGKENVINAPIPVYPPHPLQTSKQGRGIYEIHVNKAGVVTEVKILKPSGDPTFDRVTVNTLYQWRLRNGPKIIELPLVFVLTPDKFGVWIP